MTTPYINAAAAVMETIMETSFLPLLFIFGREQLVDAMTNPNKAQAHSGGRIH